MNNTYTLTVTQLNEYVNMLLSRDPLLRDIEVEGELSGFKRYRSGHCYFSLKDPESLIRGVIFRQEAMRLDFVPEDGMRVIVRGRVAIYAKDGQYQLYAQSIRPIGHGELYRRFMELKERLYAEGLFEEAHKKPIPYLPKCVGVATSESGAAYRDIVSVINRRFPNMPIRLVHSKVQGVDAPGEIIRAIARLDADSSVDVIIVGRGGGSIEDLWAYNDEGVARAIYACNTPVISAVGHEIDFTIADFVSDLRAPTPSAAAELAVPELDMVKQHIEASKRTMLSIVQHRIGRELHKIDEAANNVAFAKVEFYLDNENIQIDKLFRTLTDKLTHTIEKRSMSLDIKHAELMALSPSISLKRGFLLMHTNDNRPIYKSAELVSEKTAVVSFSDGEVPVSVI